jgi:hypothetical protein
MPPSAYGIIERLDFAHAHYIQYFIDSFAVHVAINVG